MTSGAFTGQAPAAFRLVNATQQRRALRFITDVLTGPLLYINASDYELLSQRAYTYGGRRWSDDPSALGRLPAPLLQDARASKRLLLRTLLIPQRVEAMTRSAWSAAEGLGGTCALIADAGVCLGTAQCYDCGGLAVGDVLTMLNGVRTAEIAASA